MDKGPSGANEGLEKGPDFVFPERQKLPKEPLCYRTYEMVLKYFGARTLMVVFKYVHKFFPRSFLQEVNLLLLECGLD